MPSPTLPEGGLDITSLPVVTPGTADTVAFIQGFTGPGTGALRLATLGSFPSTQGPPGPQGPSGSNNLPQYVFAVLPSVVTGQLIYVQDGRKPGEATGSGTGVVAFGSNSAWISVLSGLAVVG